MDVEIKLYVPTKDREIWQRAELIELLPDGGIIAKVHNLYGDRAYIIKEGNWRQLTE